MSTRKTIDERMDQWLNDEADRNDIADEDRQECIDLIRRTTMAAWTRLSFALNDFGEDSSRALGLHRLGRTLRGKRQG